MALTIPAVKNAKLSGKTYRFFDGGGLYLKVFPRGGRWWRLKYRFDGKEKRISLGVYPDVGLKEARERRTESLKQIAAGIDPGDHRKARKEAKFEQATNSFEVVARYWFGKHPPNWVKEGDG